TGVAGEGHPPSPGRVAVLGEERGRLVAHLLPGDRDPPRGVPPGNGVQVVAALAGGVGLLTRDMPALPVVVADEEVEVTDRPDGVVPVRVHRRPAVAHDPGAFAVGGELAGHLDRLLRIDPGRLAVLLHGTLPGPFGEQG